MKYRKSALALVALLALAGTLYFNWFTREERSASELPTRAPLSTDANSAHSPESGIRRNEPVPVTARKTSPPTTLLDRYVQSTNLLELIEQLRADADAGDAKAARIIAKAYDECAPFAAMPKLLDVAFIMGRYEDPERSIALAQKNIQSPRCNSLIATGKVNLAEVRQTERRASELDDFTSQAARLVDELSIRRSDDDAPQAMTGTEIELATRIALSQDPEAIAILSYGQMAARPDEGYAWQLVACDLGRDCSASGYVMRYQCLASGQCVGGNYRELMRRKFLPPDQYEAVLRKEREILQAIRSRDVSHLFH